MFRVVLVVWFAFSSAAFAKPPIVCQGEAKSAWVKERRELIASHPLFQYAQAKFGPFVTCLGKVTSEFDGAEFGELRFKFKRGATLTLGTMSPEASEVGLEVPRGFADEREAIAKLREAVTRTGLNIDWAKQPETSASGNEKTQSYWDLEPGLNAKARLTYRDGRLVRIGYGMAP